MYPDPKDAKFMEKITGSYPLEKALEWIRTHLEPGEVFDEQDLTAWAEENYGPSIDDILDSVVVETVKELRDAVQDKSDPIDAFIEEALDEVFDY